MLFRSPNEPINVKNNNTYYMRNSNIPVTIDNNILWNYFHKAPEFIIYNQCKSRFWQNITTTQFSFINSIPRYIIDKYLPFPLVNIAIANSV